MLQFAAIFLPGLFSMEVEDALGKHHAVRNNWRMLQRYALYTLLNLVTGILVMKAAKPGIELSISGNFTDPFLCGIYFIAVTVSAAFWGYAVKIIFSLLNFTVEKVEADEAEHEEH